MKGYLISAPSQADSRSGRDPRICVALEVAKSPLTYSYVADIASPAVEEPNYVAGTRVYVIVTTADGEEIEGELDAYQTGFYVGKTVPVLYLPSDPHKFTYEKNGLLLPLILGGAGVLLLGFGIFGLVRRERGDDDGTDYKPEDAENG